MSKFMPIIPLPQTYVFLDGVCQASKVDVQQDSSIAKEGYCLDISEDTIVIKCSTACGEQYARESLRSLKSYYGDNVPCVTIKDEPKFEFRSFMLDVGRYFYSASDVKKIIDYMAELKLNVLHFHLTEDQGWRFYSDKYPLLTEKGSKRAGTNFVKKPHSGSYSKQELIDIVAYAHAKSIIVVPEIDMPGHMRAAIACYPHLSCFNRELEVATHWGVKHDILCAGKQSTYDFIGDIIAECAEIFTDGYFHLGADEAVKTRWKLCPHCQKVIAEQGLKDEDDLQTYFLNKVVRDYVLPRGLKPIIWVVDEVPAGLDSNVIVHWYGGVSGEVASHYKAEGRTIINSASNKYYLDFPHAETRFDESYKGDLLSCVDGDVLGGTLCLWTEYVPNMARAEYLMFPRSFAGAEHMWGYTSTFESILSRAEHWYSSHDSHNFCPIEKSSPRDLIFFRTFFWRYYRQLHWEGLHNLIDNARVAIKAKKQQVYFYFAGQYFLYGGIIWN